MDSIEIVNVGSIKFINGNTGYRKYKSIKENEKICAKCKKSKLLDKFDNNRRDVDGKYPWCKECRSNYYTKGLAEKTNRSVEEIKNKYKIIDGKKQCSRCKEWKLLNSYNNSQRIISGVIEKCKSCQSYINTGYYFKEARRIKLICMLGYGGKCICCGENNINLLTIEHIRYKGHKLIRDMHTPTLMKKLIELGFPEGHTILCWNCNMSTANGSPCVHTEEYKQYYNKMMLYPYNRQKELDELEREWSNK